MTRVEKYRRYRDEISNMKLGDFSEKEETAMQIEKNRFAGGDEKLNYEQVMVVHELMNEGEVNFKRKKFIGLTKYEIFYFLIAILFVIILIVLTILVGIKLWR